MNQRLQLLCIHSVWIFMVLVGGGFVLAGWLPPPQPDTSNEELLDMFRNDDNVRVAAAMFFFGACFFTPICVAFSALLRQIEGPHHVMSYVQMLGGAIGVLAIQLPAAIWLALCYRDDIDPTAVRALNDTALFLLIGAVGPVVMQCLSIGIAVLHGDGTVYPRWLGYTNIWLALVITAGVLIPFFSDGPFTYSGVLGFWLPVTDFFVWLMLMWFYSVKAVKALSAPEPHDSRVRQG